MAEELDQFLDIIGGAEPAPAPPEARPEDSANAAADRFLAARRLDADSRAREATFTNGSRPQNEEVILARLETYRRCRAGLTEEIDTSDLDPDEMEGWTAEQIERADASNFLRFLAEEEWPRAIVEGPAEPDADGDGVERVEAGDAKTPGMHRLHQLYWDLHAPEEEEENEPIEYDVWRRDNGEWRTNFPPPHDFDPFDEDGEFGEADYSRRLTPAERDAIPDEPLESDLRERERIRAEAERDAWFARSAAGVTATGESGAAPPSNGHASIM